jgi:magnesium transporter
MVGQLLEFAEDEDLRALVASIGLENLPRALDATEDDTAADVLQQLEEGEREATLAALDRRIEVAELLEFPEESAGGIMTRGFIALPEGSTVQEAIDYLRQAKPPADRAYYLYVLDADGRLVGIVSIRDLLVSSAGTPLGEIASRDVHAITTDVDQEEAARTLQRYDLLAIPVVDEEGRLVGVTMADDLMDVLQEEATEDMYRMVGLGAQESMSLPVFQIIRGRLPWLVVNLATASVSTLILLLFRGTVERAAIAVAFVPAIANQAGVTGTQTSTIVVRALALGETYGSLPRLIAREWAVGAVSGTIVGSLLAIAAYLIEGNVTLSLILLLALAGASSVAAPVGTLVPLVLRLLRADPAHASNIFVTMITDGTSYLLALALAALVVTSIS